ncbi:MAG: hypothetical protein IPG96_08050 [Proteobacteria bacterium]|nr:hypothetical protein [Pseudomonadota bacterium]
MTTRAELAELIGSGLAGWLQLRNAEGTAALHGEDSARLALTQILRAQAAWRVAIAQQPLNWTNTKKRVDLALVPWADSVNTWYGVVEVKWPGAEFDRQKTRLDIVQDAIRVVEVRRRT